MVTISQNDVRLLGAYSRRPPKTLRGTANIFVTRQKPGHASRSRSKRLTPAAIWNQSSHQSVPTVQSRDMILKIIIKNVIVAEKIAIPCTTPF